MYRSPTQNDARVDETLADETDARVLGASVRGDREGLATALRAVAALYDISGQRALATWSYRLHLDGAEGDPSVVPFTPARPRPVGPTPVTIR